MKLNIEQYVSSVVDEFDFPENLRCNKYHDPSRNGDVIQIFFRYSPFDNGCHWRKKFAVEVVPDSDASIFDNKKLVRKNLKCLEQRWKQHFKFIFWKGVPYALNDNGDVLTLVCTICDEEYTIECPEDFNYRCDLYMIYLLGQIEHDCSDGWEPTGYNEDSAIEEGELIHRTTV
jgi:hypothetical protein